MLFVVHEERTTNIRFIGARRLRRSREENMKKGRHAARFPKEARAFVIAPELWQRFGTAEAVSDGLRVLLKMAPLTKSERSKRRKRAIAQSKQLDQRSSWFQQRNQRRL